MNNVLKAVFLLITLYVPVFVAVLTDSVMWLFMWIFITLVTVFDDDKGNRRDFD